MSLPQRSTVGRLLTGFAVALAASGLAGGACAQATSTQPSNSSIAVLQPIALAKVSDLSFGTVVRPTSGSGNVLINATTGARTITGSVTPMGSGPVAAISRAAFSVSGEGGQNFVITVPASFNMTLAGQNPMTVTLTSSMSGGTLSNALGTAGSSSFGVGGQVTIASGTPSGSYTGSFTVTVAYN
ncbi:MAG: DUF4402 domain-containing protein [Phenylobacterium sp.]